MKILCEYADCAPMFIRRGFGHVFAALGHRFTFWRPEAKPALDVFSELKPDVFLGTTYGINRALEKAIRSRPNLKVGLFCSAWGPLTDTIDRQKYPIDVASDEEKRTIERLYRETGKPDFVFLHRSDNWVEPTMGHWRSIGVTPVGILNAWDYYIFRKAQYRPELACDVGYVGGRWPYKSRNIDSFLLPLCQKEWGLRVKIFGGMQNAHWPVAEYLGQISDHDNRDLTVSATVCPNVSESHSTDLGFDCVERIFRVMGTGGFCISDYVEEGRGLFTEDELLMGEDPQAYHELVRHFVAHPEERLPFIQKGREAVLRSHTYHHRVAQFLRAWSLHEEADRALSLLSELRSQDGI